MADTRCQMCGKLSSDELEICPFCQARLTPLHIPSSDDNVDDGNLEISADEKKPDSSERFMKDASNELDSFADDEPGILPNPAELEVKEWLAGLDQGSSEVSDQGKDRAIDSSDSSQEKTDDGWLSRLNQDDNASTIHVGGEKESQDLNAEKDLVDWVRDSKEGDDSDIQSSGLNELNLPLDGQDANDDWLDRLQSSKEPLSQDIDSGSSSKDGDRTGEVEDYQDSIEEPTLDDIQTPKWLKNIQAETQDLAGDTQSDEPPTPDWMTDLQADSNLLDDGRGSIEREMPAWLREIGADSLEFNETNSSDSQTPGMDGFITSEGSDKERSEISMDETFLREGLEPLDDKDQEPDDSFPATEAPEILASDSDLVEGESVIEQPRADEGEVAEVETESGRMEDIGALNISSSSSQSSDLDDGTIDDISGELETVDLPEWLKEINTDEAPKSDELMDTEAAKKLDEIPKGELPEWIQEIQPVESMLPQDGIIDEKLNEFTENTGPLAGLTGVLPPADEITTQHQTTSHPDTPVLTGEQNQQVELFKQILNSESEPLSTPKPARKSSPRLLRWLVTFLLVAAVFLPVIIGFPPSIPASNYPPEMIQTRQVLFGLPSDSPVLLIFDYGPAYSTELESAASSIVGELINKNAQLVFISTSPTGIALADHFMDIVQSQGTLLFEPGIIKLGYLPGDIQGIASFSSNPSKTLPYATDGTLAWENQELKDVSSLSGFSAVLLLTENPEIARLWVEQAGGFLDDTPLLVVASAQAEPMIRPYYESGQVDGLVTGLAGGKAYEQTLETSGLSGSYWNSFRSGLFMIEAIIIIGGLWSFFGSLRDRKFDQKEEV